MDMPYIFLFIGGCPVGSSNSVRERILSMERKRVWATSLGGKNAKKDILKSPNPHININI